MPRHFEFPEGLSSKFWEVSVAGSEVALRFGRTGSAGQTKTKSLGDAAAAQRHAEKLVEEKTGKGIDRHHEGDLNGLCPSVSDRNGHRFDCSCSDGSSSWPCSFSVWRQKRIRKGS